MQQWYHIKIKNASENRHSYATFLKFWLMIILYVSWSAKLEPKARFITGFLFTAILITWRFLKNLRIIFTTSRLSPYLT